jgi:hypothetical protein
MLSIGAAEAQMSQPPVVGDGASTSVTGGTVSLLGTISTSNTWSGTETNTGTQIATGANKNQGGFYCGGASAVATGSTAATLTSGGPLCLYDQTSSATAAWKLANVAGKWGVYINDKSTSTTLTSTTGSFDVAGVSSLTETLSAGQMELCAGDGTNWGCVQK